MLTLQESVVAHSQSGGPSAARRQVVFQFRRAYTKGMWLRVLESITGRVRHLQDLAEALEKSEIKSRHYLGTQSVPIERIQGSEGRSRDFDASFYPLKLHAEHRWTGVAEAYRSGAVLPPVDLIKVGETYYVRDGHHRISVARFLGQTHVDAQVTVWDV